MSENFLILNLKLPILAIAWTSDLHLLGIIFLFTL